MKVYLDDCRDTPEGWARTYTVDETIQLLRTGQVTHLSLDHDLGQNADGHDLPDGYEVLHWLEWEVATSGFTPPELYVHSANGVGIRRMQNAIASIRRLVEKRVSAT